MGGTQAHKRKQDGDGSKHHTDDIQSLCMSHDREWVATGQNGKTPTVFIWDAETAQKIKKITLPKNSRSTSGIAFNRDKTMLAVADMTDKHNVLIYDLKTNKDISTPFITING